MDLFPETVTHPCPDSALELRLAANPASTHPHGASELERIVVHLFDQLQARLTNYVLAFGLSTHDAEDIIQETFFSLFRHLQLGRPQSNLTGWLFRVAHNLALKKRTANQTSSTALDHEDLLAQHPDPAHTAEESLVFGHTQKQLRAVFAALPEQDRRCLQLRAEGLKYREIAKVLGISLGAVSQSLSRSLARMARATERPR